MALLSISSSVHPRPPANTDDRLNRGGQGPTIHNGERSRFDLCDDIFVRFDCLRSFYLDDISSDLRSSEV